MTPRLLVLDSLFDKLDEETMVAGELGWHLVAWDGRDSLLAEADAAVHVRTRIDAPLLARMPRCRVVGRFGTGLDSVDLGAAQQAGVDVVNVEDYCVPEMTAHTILLGLALLRRLPAVMSQPGIPSWSAFRAQIPISGGTRAAVIGLGRIGRSVALALRSLGFEVGGVSSKPEDTLREMGLQPLTTAAAFAESDVVFLHTALTDLTQHLVCSAVLDQSRVGLILVNTARLALLDESAVAAALSTGRLGGLGVDAQLDATSPLRAFEDDTRVIVTPHIGWYSERSALQLRRDAIRATISAYTKQRARMAIRSGGQA